MREVYTYRVMWILIQAHLSGDVMGDGVSNANLSAPEDPRIRAVVKEFVQMAWMEQGNVPVTLGFTGHLVSTPAIVVDMESVMMVWMDLDLARASSFMC